MKTNNFSRKQSHYKGNTISDKLGAKLINKVARECGYKKRSGGKIKAKSLIVGFMMMVSKKMNTYESWASEVSLLVGKSLTRQAIDSRMNSETHAMLKNLMEDYLRASIQQTHLKDKDAITSKYGSIVIEDSSTLGLPAELSATFPGNVSQGEKKAQAKIHALYNYTDTSFSLLHVHSYRQNDQSLSANSLPYLKSGDLLLRDMGFLKISVLKKLDSNGIQFITRKTASVKVYDSATGTEVNLIKALKKHSCFDKQVLIGTEEQLKLRLVILPLPPEQFAERRRKAKQSRDKRLNHSKAYYQLLGYAIYLTNIPRETADAKEVKYLYRLRWQIEMIFKSWKNCFSIEKMIPQKCNNPERIYCMIYLMLIYIIIFQAVWFNACRNKLKSRDTELELSLLKMAKFFAQHFHLIFTLNDDKKIRKQIEIHCCYDARKDRLNTMQKYGKLAA